MLTLVWRDTAIRQLEEIVAYISKENLDAALRLRQMVAHCAERLPAHPYMYRRGRVSGTREAVITPNYFLVYRVTAEAIEIVRVAHTRRQYP
jgi:addiction module RelE/StbE family toxin